MFCPKCKSEYLNGVYECSECKIPLVIELPTEPELEYIEFVELLATKNAGEIALLKSILDSEGITYYFLGEYFSGVYAYAEPVRLMVKKEQRDEARDILKEFKEIN